MEPTTTTILAVIMAAMVSPEKRTRLYGTPRFLEKSLPSPTMLKWLAKAKANTTSGTVSQTISYRPFSTREKWPTSQEDRAWVISYLYAR